MVQSGSCSREVRQGQADWWAGGASLEVGHGTQRFTSAKDEDCAVYCTCCACFLISKVIMSATLRLCDFTENQQWHAQCSSATAQLDPAPHGLWTPKAFSGSSTRSSHWCSDLSRVSDEVVVIWSWEILCRRVISWGKVMEMGPGTQRLR